MKKHFFTSESVTEGHPDKMCDQISDAILDAMLEQDPESRVACETLTTTGLVVVAGEITSKAIVDIRNIVRKTINEIGYDSPEMGFDGNSCSVMVTLDEQSPDISQGVSEGEGLHNEQGAGDQGMMFGFACNETPEFLPLPIVLSHKLTKKLADLRKSGQLNYLRPDGKSQVTIEYQDGKPVRVDTVVISTQHDENVSHEQLKNEVTEQIIKPVCGEWLDENTHYHINPTGKFIIGGPVGDTGLTGRKIIVDTYGGYACHGGGAFSGKDPSKVDRSGAYISRYIAKNVVAAGLADKCEVQIAYAIGVAHPVSVLVNTFGTHKVPEEEIERAVIKTFKLKPQQIIEELKLKRPIYKKTAAYGHFGRTEPGFTWELTDKAEALREEAHANLTTPQMEDVDRGSTEELVMNMQGIRRKMPEVQITPPSFTVQEECTPIQEPIVQEQIVEPVQEYVAEQVVEPMQEYVTEPVEEPVQEYVAEPVEEPVQEYVAEPVVQEQPVVEEVVIKETPCCDSTCECQPTQVEDCETIEQPSMEQSVDQNGEAQNHFVPPSEKINRYEEVFEDKEDPEEQEDPNFF